MTYPFDKPFIPGVTGIEHAQVGGDTAGLGLQAWQAAQFWL